MNKINHKLFTKLFLTAALVLAFQPKGFAYGEDAVQAYNKGIQMTEREKYDKAIKYFQEAVSEDPRFVDAYYNLGILEEFRGNNKEAIEALEKAYKYKPDDYEIVYKLATLHYISKNLEEAEIYIKKIPPENPHFEEIVRFMSDPGKNIFSVSRQSEIKEPEIDIKKMTNGPISCKTRVNNVTELENPGGIVKDTENNLYLADFKKDSIIFIDNDGEQKVIARKGIINGPAGLAIDKYNNLYVANYNSDEIVLLPASGEKPRILPVKVEKPYFLMVDDLGFLYVSEQAKNTVSKHKLIWED